MTIDTMVNAVGFAETYPNLWESVVSRRDGDRGHARDAR